MKLEKEIKHWAATKSKKQLIKAFTILMEESIITEGTYNFDDFPYCIHSGEPLFEEDECECEDED